MHCGASPADARKWWLGELLTEKGIGNGMSVLIFTSIAARIPAEGGSILQTRGGLVFAVVCVIAVMIIGVVVYVEITNVERSAEFASVEVLPDGNNVWNYTIPDNTTGLVLEAFWEPQSELSKALVVKASIPQTGEVLAFVESMSPLRIQMSKVALAQNLAAGHSPSSIVVTPGAGTGNHDHGAAGAFFQQPFQLVMTAFFNGPVDPSYSVVTG